MKKYILVGILFTLMFGLILYPIYGFSAYNYSYSAILAFFAVILTDKI